MRNLLSFLIILGAVTTSGCSGDARSAPTPVSSVEAAETQPQYTSIEAIEAAAIRKDVPYVPTPQETVDEMLQLAEVSRNDVVYDLGSGDGRIVITAAKQYGARGVGIDIDPNRITEANENAQRAGVTDKVRFIQGDLFAADLSEATAVTLYLLRSVNIRLRPKLLAELRPGTPIVSHDFDMGEWEPEVHKRVNDDDVYLWIVPAKVEGKWRWTDRDGRVRTAQLRQEFQKFSGSAQAGGDSYEIRNGRVRGNEISFDVTRGGGDTARAVERYQGRINGRTIDGTVEAGGTRAKWRAQNE